MSFLQVNSGEPKSWGKLTSINTNLQNVTLVGPAYKIGRNSTNDIPISDVRISGIHCILSKSENGTITVQDLSSNGTFVEDQKVGKGKSKVIVSGNRFTLLPASKIPEKDMLGYVFTANTAENNALKRQREKSPEQRPASPNTLAASASPNKQIKPPASPTKEEKEQNKCLMCNNYIYQCLTTIPCMHAFCGACYCASVGVLPMCPVCVQEVTELKRDKKIDDQVQKFLERYPQFQRSAEELRDMNKKNKFPNGHVFPKKAGAPKPQPQRQEPIEEEQKATPQRQQQQQQQAPKEQKPKVAENRNPAAAPPKQNAPSAQVEKEQKPLTKKEKYHLLMSKFVAE